MTGLAAESGRLSAAHRISIAPAGGDR